MNIVNLVEELRKTKGKKDHISILQKYLKDEKIKAILWYCYNPFVKFYITKATTSKYGKIHLEDDFEGLEKLLKKLSSRQLSGKMAKEEVALFASKFTKEDVDILTCIFKKSLESGIAVKTINTALNEEYIPQFEVQLANSYMDFKSKKKSAKVKRFWESVKMNGIRGYWIENTADVLNSRKGLPLYGFDHLVLEIQQLADEYNLQFVDGELFSTTIPFHQIQSIVMSEKHDDLKRKRELKLNIFALGVKGKNLTTDEMVNLIEEMRTNENFKYIEFVKYGEIENDYEKIKEKCQEYLEEGQEGIMLRSVEMAYSFGRSDDLLKYKPIMDVEMEENHKICELRITDFKEGSGWCQGSLGSLRCCGYLPDGKTYVETWCGSGFDEDERKEIWNNREKYLGGEIELKYATITTNSKTGNNSLEFPIKLCIKIDR